MNNVIKTLIILICTCSYLSLDVKANIFIDVRVNDQIITNYDIQIESAYIKILNPDLQNITKKQLYNLSRKNLITEIIKKSEIVKFVNIKQKNPLIDNYFEDLYKRLGYQNENEFLSMLKNKNSYTKDQIKNKIKIELIWNELIYSKYKNQVKIDKKKLSEKVNSLNNKLYKEYLISEIVFRKVKDKTIEDLKSEILLSIKEIGFENTANIYSIAESSKFGGKVGWINANNLSKNLLIKIENLENGKNTDIIKISNSFIILKKNDTKIKELKINKEKELEKLINFETNRQLDQFSKIYFDKSKINYFVNEN
ncbi:peptidylprolyl isomerase [Candidatus Pelagibacter communis]|uniref:peptidylprolyl isomerase n=1 Tax=Candidatus Pelagibacter TaxID=198251 RepID=UPI003EDFF294